VNYIPAYFGGPPASPGTVNFKRQNTALEQNLSVTVHMQLEPIHTLNVELGQHRHAFLLKFQRTVETPLL